MFDERFLTMENYVKGETREVEDALPFTVDENTINMKVNAGSKIRNLMGFALKKMKEPAVKQITWNGTGHAITKTITCCEIMKRKIKGLHQITKIRFRRTEELWEPKMEGLERLKVNRDVPAISILLSKEPLDANEPGYQAPGSYNACFPERVSRDHFPRRHPRLEGVDGKDSTSGKSRQKKKKVNSTGGSTSGQKDVKLLGGATPS